MNQTTPWCQVNWNDYWQKLQKARKPTQAELLVGIKLRAFQDFQFFVETFFPHHCRYPFSSMHRDFFTDEQGPDQQGRRDVIAAPRGHAKTTFKVLFKALHAIVYGYESFIMVIGRTKEDAREKVGEILQELEENTILKQIYGPLLPTKRGNKSPSSFTTANGVTVMAKSRGQSLRGLKKGANRPTLIICDDIESLEETLSPEQRQKTLEWFMKDILPMGQIDGSTNITVIGTCLHPESLIEKLLAAPGWNGRRYQAVQTFSTREDLWQTYHSLYTDLSNPERVKTAQRFYEQHQAEMTTGVKLLWPEAESYLRLMQMRINEGEAAFLSEKQNVPWDPSRTVFDMDKAKRFKLVYQAGQIQGLQWLDDSQRFVPMEDILKTTAFHDPVPGKSINGDYAALVVVAQDRHGFMYCLDAWLGRENPNTQVQKAMTLHAKWKLDRLYLEENNFQGLIRTIYYDANQAQGSNPLSIEGVHATGNKELRISSIEPFITNGHLLFSETLDPAFITQLKLYPTTHDDGPDALQGAVAQLKRANLAELWQAGI